MNRAAGARGRAARQGGGAVRADGHDGEPDRAARVTAQRGDDVLAGEAAHCVLLRVGRAARRGRACSSASSGRAGCSTRERDASRRSSRASTTIRRRGSCALENTHNRGGRARVPAGATWRDRAAAHERGLALHLDGARLWNAAVATGSARLRELAAPVDTRERLLLQGAGRARRLGLAGRRELIARAHRYRKMLGGGMRQAGMLAAAALYALDHTSSGSPTITPTRALADRLSRIAARRVDSATVADQHRRTSMLPAGQPTPGASAIECHAPAARRHASRRDRPRPPARRGRTLEVSAATRHPHCARLALSNSHAARATRCPEARLLPAAASLLSRARPARSLTVSMSVLRLVFVSASSSSSSSAANSSSSSSSLPLLRLRAGLLYFSSTPMSDEVGLEQLEKLVHVVAVPFFQRSR